MTRATVAVLVFLLQILVGEAAIDKDLIPPGWVEYKKVEGRCNQYSEKKCKGFPPVDCKPVSVSASKKSCKE
jgi:hypothetical protein